MAIFWTIIADGPEVILEDVKPDKLLVLDGAINRFKDLSFYPDVLLGDFDSIDDPGFWGVKATFDDIDENSPPYMGNFGIEIVPAKDQNYTDLEKGIMYADKQGARSIHIIQASGGRMDHTLGNIGLLRKYYRKDRKILFLTNSEQIFFVKDEDVLITGGIGETAAIMGYPDAVMTTSGLAYNGTDYPLKLGIQESVCNTIVEPETRISIKGEALIILPKVSQIKI